MIWCAESLRLPVYCCLVTLLLLSLIPETGAVSGRDNNNTKDPKMIRKLPRVCVCVPVLSSVERVETLISCRSSSVSVWKRRMEEPSENAIHTPPPAHAMWATLTIGSGWTSNFCGRTRNNHSVYAQITSWKVTALRILITHHFFCLDTSYRGLFAASSASSTKMEQNIRQDREKSYTKVCFFLS